MKLKKKTSISGEWARIGEDIREGQTIEFIDSGKEVEGDYGPRIVFQVLTGGGEKLLSLNQTSINNLVDAFGENTEDWPGNPAKVYIVKQKIGDKLRNVVYLCGLDWDMMDDGTFAKRNPGAGKRKAQEDDDIPII